MKTHEPTNRRPVRQADSSHAFRPYTFFVHLVGALFFTTGLSGAETRLTFPTLPGYPALTVPVPVRLTRATNVTAGQFDVAYDPSKIIASAPELGFGAPNHVFRSRVISPGVHRVLFYSLNNAVASNRVTTTMPFTLPATERVGSGPILPGNVKLSRADATAITPVTVTPGEVFVVPAYVFPDGSAQFFFQSQPGSNYVVQASVNLVEWTNISTNMATGDFLDLVDADAVFYPWRFYRLRLE